jgi:hypothetical protein
MSLLMAKPTQEHDVCRIKLPRGIDADRYDVMRLEVISDQPTIPAPEHPEAEPQLLTQSMPPSRSLVLQPSIRLSR